MDSLRQGIGLRGYGGKNPKQEYKREAYALFEELLNNLQHEVVKFLSLVQIKQDESADAIERKRIQEQQKERTNLVHQNATALAADNADNAEGANGQAAEAQQQTPYTREAQKVGRNEPCPCGSGKKFKQCHGKLG